MDFLPSQAGLQVEGLQIKSVKNSGTGAFMGHSRETTRGSTTFNHETTGATGASFN